MHFLCSDLMTAIILSHVAMALVVLHEKPAAFVEPTAETAVDELSNSTVI